MANHTYTCPGCGKLRKAPDAQDIAKCRICGTTVERIDGIWVKSKAEQQTVSFKVSHFLIGIIFLLLGFFTIEPIINTRIGKTILNQSFLFWGIASLLVISTVTLVLGFIIERKTSFLVLQFCTLFIMAALIRLSFVEKTLPLTQSVIYNTTQNSNNATSDSVLSSQLLYSSEEKEDLTQLFFELMTDKYLVEDINNSSNLSVKKTLDTSENNYDYEITPSETNNRFPNGFRISIREVTETDLQNQYYEERTGGLGLKIPDRNSAIQIKNDLVQRFEDNYEIFESTPQSNNNHWISIKGENYFWIRFLTLEDDFTILEIVRYMNDADARQHKKVMEQVNSNRADKSVDPKPLSPQEALACKQNAANLDDEQKELKELELRLAYLDFGDPKSEKHLDKETEFNNRTQKYNLDLKLYESGCENNVSLDYPTYEKVCNSADVSKNNSNTPLNTAINRFCAGFKNYASRISN